MADPTAVHTLLDNAGGKLSLSGDEVRVADTLVVGILTGRMRSVLEYDITVTVTAGAEPVNTALPGISGVPVVGEILSASTGTWTGSDPKTYAYQWLRNAVAISGATNAVYTIVEADVGTRLSVQVTATNAEGSASAVSAQTDPITDELSLILSADGADFTISGLVGAFTIEITSGPFAGTYPATGTYNQADFIGQPPLILADPIRTGTLSAGQLQTMTLGPVLYDPGPSVLAQTASWQVLGAEVSDTLTYTLTSGDLTTGVQFTQSASNFYGSTSRGINAVNTSYVPNAIVFNGTNSQLVKSDGIADTNSDTLFGHFCVRLNATTQQYVFASTGDDFRLSFAATTLAPALVCRNTANTSLGNPSFPGGGAPSITTGTIVHVLTQHDVRSSLGATGGLVRMAVWHGGTVYVTNFAGSVTTAALIDLATSLTVGSSTGSSNRLNGDVFRAALWAGVTIPDITNPTVQANFWQSDGTPRPVSLANTLLGASPVTMLAETAADANALVNPGTSGAFTSKTGTFTEVGI
jgi:hypothetical protein